MITQEINEENYLKDLYADYRTFLEKGDTRNANAVINSMSERGVNVIPYQLEVASLIEEDTLRAKNL